MILLKVCMGLILMFENQLQSAMFNSQNDKTFIDKLLSRQDVEAIRELIKKPKLYRPDIMELQYLVSGAESKLLNYSEWDRYIILKFFVWIREFTKIAELLYDYQEKLKIKANTCLECHKFNPDFEEFVKNALKIEKPEFCGCDEFRGPNVLTPRTITLINNNERMIEHNIKFLADLYLNIGRTSLSLGATAFIEILKNKFEMSYSGLPSGSNTPDVPKGMGGVFRGSKI